MTAHRWTPRGERSVCSVCAMRSDWPGARDACPPYLVFRADEARKAAENARAAEAQKRRVREGGEQ